MDLWLFWNGTQKDKLRQGSVYPVGFIELNVSLEEEERRRSEMAEEKSDKGEIRDRVSTLTAIHSLPRDCHIKARTCVHQMSSSDHQDASSHPRHYSALFRALTHIELI